MESKVDALNPAQFIELLSHYNKVRVIVAARRLEGTVDERTWGSTAKTGA
jgi:hypothetical protein